MAEKLDSSAPRIYGRPPGQSATLGRAVGHLGHAMNFGSTALASSILDNPGPFLNRDDTARLASTTNYALIRRIARSPGCRPSQFQPARSANLE